MPAQAQSPALRGSSASHLREVALLSRLVDGRGDAYYPETSPGSGPPSLGETGYLRRGETARARLGFLVPRRARGLSLVFEPLPSGRVQVRVPLRRA